MADPRIDFAPVITVSPEFLERLDRVAAALEGIAGALVPVEVTVETSCGVPIFQHGRPSDAVPLECTRPAGHDPGHVAHDEDGHVIACTLGRPPATPEGWVCPACGQGAEVGS